MFHHRSVARSEAHHCFAFYKHCRILTTLSCLNQFAQALGTTHHQTSLPNSQARRLKSYSV